MSVLRPHAHCSGCWSALSSPVWLVPLGLTHGNPAFVHSPLASAKGSLGGASSRRPELRGPPTGNHGRDFLFPPPSPPLHFSFLLTPTHALAHSFSILPPSPISFPSHTLSPGPASIPRTLSYQCSITAGRLRFLALGPWEHTEPLLASISSDVGSQLTGLLRQCNEIIRVKCYSSAWQRGIAQC